MKRKNREGKGRASLLILTWSRKSGERPEGRRRIHDGGYVEADTTLLLVSR